MPRTLAVIVASLVVPPALSALLFVVCHELEQASSVSLFLDYVPTTVSTAAGFMFLARRFRRHAAAIGLVYIPVTFVVLGFWTLMLAGFLYDNYL